LRNLTDGQASFTRVQNRMMPIIRQTCHNARRSAPTLNCNFNIKVIANAGRGPDARMGLDRNGKPLVTFNTAMLQATQNDDELAMVLAHEAAHQIAQHIEKRKSAVIAGAQANATKAQATGGDVKKAATIGAVTAAVVYSQAFELQADKIATQMILRGGYAPKTALNLLDRLPENSQRLSLHPTHPARIQLVEQITREFLAEEANSRVLPIQF
jgi:Zn-dependent protease with chaperone function